MKTVATNSKKKSKKFTPPKSEKFASKKKKTYQKRLRERWGEKKVVIIPENKERKNV